jgi:hypothetical protein
MLPTVAFSEWDHRGGSLHLDGLGDRTGLEHDIDAGRAVGEQAYALSHTGLKTLEFGLDSVGARRKIGYHKLAGGRGRGLGFDVGLFVDDRNAGVRDHASAGIGDGADDAACDVLPQGGGNDPQQKEKHE